MQPTRIACGFKFARATPFSSRALLFQGFPCVAAAAALLILGMLWVKTALGTQELITGCSATPANAFLLIFLQSDCGCCFIPLLLTPIVVYSDTGSKLHLAPIRPSAYQHCRYWHKVCHEQRRDQRDHELGRAARHCLALQERPFSEIFIFSWCRPPQVHAGFVRVTQSMLLTWLTGFTAYGFWAQLIMPVRCSPGSLRSSFD